MPEHPTESPFDAAREMAEAASDEISKETLIIMGMQYALNWRPEEIKVIIVEVRGGLVSDVTGVPNGYVVEVRDFDAGDFGVEDDEVEHDEKGNPYWLTEYESDEARERLIQHLKELTLGDNRTGEV